MDKYKTCFAALSIIILMAIWGQPLPAMQEEKPEAAQLGHHEYRGIPLFGYLRGPLIRDGRLIRGGSIYKRYFRRDIPAATVQ